MGRRRSKLCHLPPRMQQRHGAYYHVATVAGSQKWTRLAPSSDYGQALRAWAEIEGRSERIGETVADAVQTYIADCATRVQGGKLSQKTLDGYQQSSIVVLAVLGDVALETLTDQDVRRYRSSRTGSKGQPAPIAANRDLALVSAAYGHAAELGWIPATCNPCRHVKRNQESPRDRYVTDAELTRALAACPPILRWKHCHDRCQDARPAIGLRASTPRQRRYGRTQRLAGDPADDSRGAGAQLQPGNASVSALSLLRLGEGLAD